MDTTINRINPIVCPFIDLELNTWSADELDFYSDASKEKNLRFGGVYKNSWIYLRWPKNFIE